MADSAGILFKIKGDSSDAVRALKQTETAAQGLTGTTTGLTSGLASLAGPAAAAAAAVVAIGTAALAVTSKLFDLSKAAAAYGSAIYDASQQTGLTTETMSALKVAAEQAGSSFEAITADVAKFNVLLGQAATGNEKAQKVLQQYGITATETDKALEQAILHIAQMSSQSEQAAAATALFKDRTGEILPVIKSFDGDLPALMDKLRDLGLLMSKEDAAAADEFGDQMDTLNAQLDAVTRQIGFAVMPVFLKFATSLSNWLATNKSEITSWANTIGAAFSTASGWLIKIYDDARRALAAIQAIALVTAQGPSGIAQAATIVGTTEQRIQNDAISRSNPQVGTGTVDSETGTFTAGGSSAAAPKIKTSNIGRADSQADADAVIRAREIRDLTAQIAIENINLRTTQDAMAAGYEEIRKKLGEGTSIVGYTQATNEATKQWADNLQNSLSFIEQLEIKALKKDATQAERDLLTAQQQDRRHQLKLKQDDEIKKNQDALFKAQEEQWAKQAKADADKAVADQDALIREQDAMDLRIGQALGANPLRGGGPSPADDEEGGGIFGAWTRSWDEFVERVAEDAPTLQDTFTDLLEIGRGAFEGMARAVGQLVQQWVIYGNTAPGAAKKALAGILAAVAAEAAVKAIMATAEGFFFLATHKYDSAANAFTAAAFYGSVAAVAAVTGRLVAGNSFNQQASKATGQGSSSASGGRGGGSGNQGEAYSPYGNQATVYEQSRNAPATAVHVKISDDSQWLGKMLKFQIETNSDVRDSIRSTAEG